MSNLQTFTTAAWAETLSRSWLANADGLEAMLEPVHVPLFGAAALVHGEAVVDVGCGRGASARAAAAQVGTSGRVIGLDVSAELIAAADKVYVDPGGAELDWIVADGQRADLTSLDADVVISRFGIMFFDDPVAGFANLRSAVRPGGRLAVAVWQPRDASPFQVRSLKVAVATAAEHGYTLQMPEPANGPFAFGVPDYTTNILTRAGWSDVEFEPRTMGLHVGGPGTSPADATALGMSNGPLSLLVEGLPTDVLAAIADAVEASLAECWDGTGVALDAAIAIVTAVSPLDSPAAGL